jgi:hypothetical protein
MKLILNALVSPRFTRIFLLSLSLSISFMGFTQQVDIVTFSSSLDKDHVELNWLTASENDLKQFVIEKSYDSRNYQQTAVIKPKGSIEQKERYVYTDSLKELKRGVIFYRIRSVDNSGKSKVSRISIVKLNETNSSAFTAFPNPFVNQLTVTVPAKWQNKAVRFEVYNTAGQKLKEVYDAETGQTETLAFNDLKPGVYILKAICGTEINQQKIIKD